ncbi:MAG: glycosyltransferase [Aulosira sp. ZfuVER01]|nr:glycosyltransferase [Aulosira sp. ZfuVER01]MDZ7996521.1 glycosyltransferase [Aulosira sp. DedVER01a]MDZ8056370.1 glycosyltransferase [Aulosira sp. ZfuCHP01]
MTELKKIMFFAPYAWWSVHSQVDAVVASALRLRNCEIFVVGCDGVYKNCNVAHFATQVGYEYADACQACSQTSKQLLASSFNLPYLQLRDWISDKDYNIANQWVENLVLQDYKNAVYFDLPIGKWVTSSICTYFRISSDIELSRPEVRKVHKQYLIDGLITYKAISRLIDTYNPTNLFLFNARFAPYSVAFEVAKQHQIDVIAHERGFIADSFGFFDNSNCLSPKTPLDCVKSWKDIPLNKQEISQVKKYFIGRENGQNLSWPSFYDFHSNHTNVRHQLRIPVDAKVVTVFTSSEDEHAMSEDYKVMTKQLDIIESLMEIFRDRDEYLVIRHHPFITGAGSKTFLQAIAYDFLSKAYQQVLSAPKNVRIIMPSEQLTSYALLWHSDAAIAFFSTVALEAAARGVPTATFEQSPYREAVKHTFQQISQESLGELVERLLSASCQATVEDLIKLYRFTDAYFFKFSTKFRSIGIKDYHLPDFKIKSLDDLKPGIDPALDRICNRIIHNTSIYDIPTDERKNNPNFEELNFFNNELQEIEEYRQKIKSQALESNYLSAKPSVAIISLNYINVPQTDKQLLPAWKNQSRHQNLIVYDCHNLDWYDYQGIIDSIINCISLIEEEYILITNDYIQYDESFISSALDILLAADHKETAGVIFGAWIASSSRINQEIFTERVPAKSYLEAIEVLPLLQFPQNLLSFGLIHKDFLLRLLTSVKSASSHNPAGVTIFNGLQQPEIQRVELPMLIIEELNTHLHQDRLLEANQIPQLNTLASAQSDTYPSKNLNQHILLYTDDFSIYGVGQYNHSIICELAKLGYQVTCVQTHTSNHLIQEQQKLGIQHLWLNYNSIHEFSRTLLDISDAQEIFPKIKPDLIIFSDCCPLSNLAAKKVAKQMGIPYIIVDGCAVPYLAERFASYLEELEQIHTQAGAFITVSNENLNLLHQLFRLPKHKGQVIYSGRPEHYFAPPKLSIRDRLRQEYGIPANAVICFTAARLDAGKGYQYQLEAIKQLMQSESWHKLYFVWAGDGALEAQLKQAIEQLKISNHVKLLGNCTNIVEWLDTSDIFVLPSEFESFGLAIVEAMAKELPVIAPAVGGIPEVLGDVGKLVSDPKINPQATIEEMARTIEAWSLNPELRRSIGLAGKKRAEAMFKEERMIKQTMEVVERTLLLQRNQVSSSFANMPLVSVIISCYNLAEFLPETVASVIAQTYENWEIIIVNDGSKDNTSEVAQQLISTYFNKKIRLVEKANGGPASARNAGIRVSNGEYILPLDADDKLSSTGIENLLSVALNQDSPCVAFGSYQMFGIENKLIVSAGLFSKENMKRFDMIHNSSLYSKKVWNLVKGYKEDVALIGYEDWEFWLNCLKHKINFYGTQEIVIYYRRSVDSTGNRAFTQHHNKFALIVAYNSEIFNPTIIKESENLLLSFGLIKKSSELSNELEELLLQINSCVNQYQQQPSSHSAIANLCQARQKFAEKLLTIPAEKLIVNYSEYLGDAHQKLLNSGIKHELLTEKEQNFVNTLSDHIAKGFGESQSIQYLLAGMLYCRADQLPLQYDLTHIPQWLLADYLKFILEFPRLFQEKGEANNYYRYLQQWLDYLQENISSNPESVLWQYIANFFLQAANFSPLYFTTENLKEIYIKRAEIMEYALKTQGYEIDYDFPERSLERKKMRLGVLAAHFQLGTETFHTLPAYKHLDWNRFEIILYTVSANNSRLERYCAGHVDALVILPSDLQSQVQTIRNGDLDLLLIATNVTLVTNQITLLALHRLARLQLTFGSCPATTGIRNIDYFISGRLSEPVSGGQKHYREKLVTLDGVGYCFDYPSELETPTIKPYRESWGASEKTVVFTSGANFYKIIPEVRETWVKILAAVPDSILVLYPFAPSWSNSYPANSFLNQMYAVLAKYDVDKSRLIVLNALPSRADVKEVLKLADVYLDSYRHSGGHSLVDALEVGLTPVVLEGEPLRSKHGSAYLKDIEMPDLVTDNEIDYINLAIALGNNPELRQQKSAQIKEKMQGNPSFLDSRSYSAKIGKLFQELFSNYLADNLSQNLPLNETNLIIFPDWSQPEDLLYQDLSSVISALTTHPDKSQITLLIDTHNISEEEADMLLSSLTINLLMEEDVDITEGPEISLLGQISDIQWETLLPKIQTRIALTIDNPQAIAQVKADKLPVCELDSLSVFQLEVLPV